MIRIYYIYTLQLTAIFFSESDPYFGTYVGKISNKEEGISGKVYCVDKNTIFIQNFTYTGRNSRKRITIDMLLSRLFVHLLLKGSSNLP